MADPSAFFDKLFQLLRHEELWAPLAVVLPTLAFVGFWFGRYFPKDPQPRPPYPNPELAAPDPQIAELTAKLLACTARTNELDAKLEALEEQLKTALERERQGNKLMEAVLSDESQLWRLYEARPTAEFPPPIHRSRPRILLVANNKGGVGKTNLAVLLAAYFEKQKNFKVLLVDLDNQASLTAWMIHAAGLFIPPEHSHRLGFANKLLDGTACQHWQTEVLTNTHVVGRFTKAQLATADVTLTEHETKLMLRFFAQGGTPDVRYHMAEALLSERVQGKPGEKATFDLVIIDAPPRLTTGVVGALVASTHLLVPTKLDALSAETVEGFLRQAWAIREKFNTGLELAGVVGTMTPAQPLDKPLGQTELDAVGIVRTGLQQWHARTHYFARDVQERAAIKHAAGREVAYFQDDIVRDMINALGDELCGRIGL